MFNIKNLSIAVLFASGVTYAELDVNFKVGYQAVSGSYSDSSDKKSILSNGVILNATFLDDLTITHTSTDTKIKFDNPANNIKQTSKFTTVGYNLYSDKYGTINLRADYQSIDNDDATGATDNVSINSLQASMLPYSEEFYTEVGYSKSKYPGNNLKLDQVNVSYGSAITDSDWMTFKAFYIKPSDTTKTQNKSNFSSLETKYKYFMPKNFLDVDNIEATLLTGKRMFAVDGAAGSAYNMGDMQTGSFGITGEWKFGENANLLASVSRESYTTSTNIDYTGNYKYLNFNYNF
jgi:hypothetical protein